MSKGAHSQSDVNCPLREARSYRAVERFAEHKTGYSVLSDSSGDVGRQQELHRFVAGSQHMQQAQKNDHTAEAQKAMPGADLKVEEPVHFDRCSLVGVHTSSQPSHLPFERWSVRMPLKAEA